MDKLSVEKPTEKPIANTARKVSGRNMPDICFTGELHLEKKSDESQFTSEVLGHPLSEEDVKKVKSVWSVLLKQLEDSGKIRLLAALSHCRFKDGSIVVTVSNKAIEQEVLDARSYIQELIYGLSRIRPRIVVIVTKDEVFINRPVSDSQRLQAIIAKNPKISLLCEQLRLKL